MLRPLPILLTALLCAAPVRADVVHLISGGKLEGDVEDLGDRLLVHLRTGKTEVPKEKVARVEKKAIPWVEYAKRRQELELAEAGEGSHSAVKRYALAGWCTENGLKPEAIDELLIGIRQDPQHKATQDKLRELGMEEREGRWMTHAQKMEADGFALYEGKWIPFEDAAEKRNEKDAVASIRTQQVRARGMLKNWKNPAKREAAVAELATLDLPARVRPLQEATHDGNEDLRRFALEELKKIKIEGIANIFFMSSIEDPSYTNRKFARDTLRELGADEFVQDYLWVLRNDGGMGRAYAADALGDIGDGSAVVHLVYTLYKVTLEVRAANAQISKPIDGVAVDTVGAGTVTVETPRNHLVEVQSTVIIPAGESLEEVQNSVAGALAKITGRDYGTSPKSWSEWWKEEGKKKYSGKK